MATSPANILQVVSKPAGKGVTGYAALVGADGNDLPAVGFSQAAFVEDAGDADLATVAAAVDAIRDALVAANLMAAE